MTIWCHQRSPEAGTGTSILSKPKKVTSILTKTHINHGQIHHTRNNWLGPIFFPPGERNTKKCFFCFIWVTKVWLRLTLIQKEGLCSLTLSWKRALSYRNQLKGGGGFFEGLQDYTQNKNEGNETKIMLWRLKLYGG